MSVIGLIPWSLAQGHLGITNNEESLTHFFAHILPAWTSGCALLLQAFSMCITHPYYHVPCPSPLANPWPLLPLLLPPWSFLLHQPIHLSLVLLNPALPSPEIADILGSLSPPHFSFPLSPQTSLMRVEGLLGLSFTCPWGTVPCVSLFCNSPPVKGNEGLFIYQFIYLFTYLCRSDKASKWKGTI